MKAVVLLSGGLDSVISMLMARQEAETCLAITVDYGQKARKREIMASQYFCKFYGIRHLVIELPFMSEIQSGLLEAGEISEENPWVPNRNGLFVNLAATYAENMKADWVVCGFNREEAGNFPDNSLEFVEAANKALYYSTLNQVKVLSFVQDMDKVEIVKKAVEMGVDFRNLWSCYQGGEKPCGQCPSCLQNLKAFYKAGVEYL